MIDKSARIRVAIAPVKYVHDGDTFVVDYLDLGWGVKIHPIDEGSPAHCSIRLTLPDGGKYDAPETKDKARNALAVAYLKSLIPPGTKLFLVSWGFTLGRTLASATLPDGRDLATLMIEAGHVK